MKFTEKTIKRLAEIGIKPTIYVPGQYCCCSSDYEVYVYDEWILINDRQLIAIETKGDWKNKEKHTLRYETLKALKLAEQAEKIIKENGK